MHEESINFCPRCGSETHRDPKEVKCNTCGLAIGTYTNKKLTLSAEAKKIFDSVRIITDEIVIDPQTMVIGVPLIFEWHYKKLKAVRDQDGKIRIYEPDNPRD